MKPSRVIGEKYLSRWYLIPKNRWFNVYLHKFEGSDDDRALHDHPWWSCSFLLKGHIIEELETHYRTILGFWPYLRSPTMLHRIELVSEEPAWTLFITGPKVRDWGFDDPEEGWTEAYEWIAKHQ